MASSQRPHSASRPLQLGAGGLPSLKNKSETSHKKSENIDSHAYMHKNRHKHKHTLWPLCSNPTISWA